MTGHLTRIAEVRAGTVPAKVRYPTHLRAAVVLRTGMVGASLVRVTLGGPGIDGFESHAPDEHVRLIFPEEDGSLRLPERDGDALRWPRPLPTSREYTVRRYDPVGRELDIDIALHGSGGVEGLGAAWARSVCPGETVHVAGPPGGLIVPHYDRYLLGGDLTALPAIARRVEELPRTARGWAFVEVADAREEIELNPPEGVEVRWLHHAAAAPGTAGPLADAVRSVEVPRDERVYVWLAGEAGELRPLRRWVRDELRLDKADYDITGYWKRGVTDFDEEDEHESPHH